MKTSEAHGALAGLLREVRRSRGFSQLELASRLGVSQRHVSYVELARARPGRQLLQAWLEEVEASDALRNAALLHAGFSSLGDPAQDSGGAVASEAARLLLTAHEPYPAICVDTDWMLLDCNPARRRINRIVMPRLPSDVADASSGIDMIDLLGRPDGLLENMRDAARIGWSVLGQLKAECWANRRMRPRVERLEQQLRLRYAEPAPRTLRASATTQLRLDFDTEQGPLFFFSTQLMAGLPQNITPAAPRITLWHPADSGTRETLLALR